MSLRALVIHPTPAERCVATTFNALGEAALGEVLDRGDAGLVVVYPPDMPDLVATSVTAASSKVRPTAGITPEQLAAEVRPAEELARRPAGALRRADSIRA